MIITPMEVFDIVIMVLAIGFIFSGFIKRRPSEDYDPLKYYSKKSTLWEDMKFAAIIAAPAVVLHEFGHKLVAMGFGATATIHAPYFFYAIVALLRLINFPLLFFIGGYVAHSMLPPLQSAFVSLAGPAVNFLLWGLCTVMVKFKWVKGKYNIYLIPMARLNLLLGAFNMIPIPGFDGWGFFSSLFKVFFG